MNEALSVVDLARYLIETPYEQIPDAILERGRGLLVDQIAVSLVGSRQSTYVVLEELLHEQGMSRAGASLVLSTAGTMTSASTAALLNAASAHIAELGEGVSRAVVHVSNAVVPAALAEATALGVSGAQLVRAVTLGCETMIRFGLLLNGPEPGTKVEGDVAEAYLLGWWTPSMLAPIGAATAVVLLNGGTVGQLLRAWCMALNTAPATTARFVHDGAAGKGYAMGVASNNGYMTAKLALSEPVDEREAYLVEDWAGMIIDTPRTAYLNRSLGSTWEIDFPLYKFFASVGPLQSPVEATLQIVAQHHIDPAEVTNIKVEGYARVVSFSGEAIPHSAEEAKTSLLHHIAVALVMQRSDVFIHDAFCEPMLSDPLINSLAQRVTAVVHPEFNAEYPYRSARARVTVEMKDGKSYSQEVDRDQMSKYHHPSRAELNQKFIGATAFILSSDCQTATLEALWTLEQADNVAPIIRQLRKGWLR